MTPKGSLAGPLWTPAPRCPVGASNSTCQKQTHRLSLKTSPLTRSHRRIKPEPQTPGLNPTLSQHLPAVSSPLSPLGGGPSLPTSTDPADRPFSWPQGPLRGGGARDLISSKLSLAFLGVLLLGDVGGDSRPSCGRERQAQEGRGSAREGERKSSRPWVQPHLRPGFHHTRLTRLPTASS